MQIFSLFDTAVPSHHDHERVTVFRGLLEVVDVSWVEDVEGSLRHHDSHA
nr:MAG: hypothetical protein J07AB56_06570 [Candidatus Nanosalinarum sp. J07AB56]